MLGFFGLISTSDDRFAVPVAPQRRDETPRAPAGAKEGSETRATFAKAARTAAVYFGLAEAEAGASQPGRSLYGNVSPALDAELNALRARVEALEARLRETAGPDIDDRDGRSSIDPA
ncbi:MAG TPA: hypothetical protein VI300_18715 [Solirubrobacter sp.]